MKVVSINKEYTTTPVSLEDIFNMTGANLEDEVLEITPLTGGKWFKLPEPILVDTLDGPKPATEVWLNGNTNYMEIEMEDGSLLKVTHHHKFLVKQSDDSFKWTMAIDLEAGLYLKSSNDKVMSIKSINVTDNRAIMMDINVEDVHHYILENGVVSHNSSISGATTNGIYPVRDLYLNKTNDTMSISYVAPDSTKLKKNYQIAWDIPQADMIDIYCIIQKWTDQAISADEYRRIQGVDKVSSTEMLNGYFRRYKYGLKQRYYVNSLTNKGTANKNNEAVYPDDSTDNTDDGYCDNCSI